MIAFHNAHPERAGARLILQDTEQVLSSASVPSSIEKMPHDFFQEQPVKGARAYYFHRVVRSFFQINVILPAYCKHETDRLPLVVP